MAFVFSTTLFVLHQQVIRKLDKPLHCMSTVELKNVLIHRISEITDVSFLEAA